MDWMSLAELYSMLYGPGYLAGPPPYPYSQPTEADIWITQRTYEFVAARSACGKCGALIGRRLRVAAFHDLGDHSGPTWRIGVGTRCRGWRRHRHTALVTPWRGGLRFGALELDASLIR